MTTLLSFDKLSVPRSITVFLMALFMIISPTGVVFALETINNVGIIKSGIWYSKDPFYAGDKVRIYTLVFNGSDQDLMGEVVFDDNGKVLCRGNFTATSGKSQEIWCDWTATLGEHKISAKIVSPKVAPIGEAPRDIILLSNVSGVSDRKVEKPPKKMEPISEELLALSSTTSNVSASTSSSALEKNISDGLSDVRGIVTQVLPDRISTEEVLVTGNKIASATPKIIRNNVTKVLEKLGVEKIKGPLIRIVDFFVAIYNFVIGDPLLIVIIIFLIVWKIAKYIYERVIWP
jgi:hypothetical protein